jgi:hypothetical protein
MTELYKSNDLGAMPMAEVVNLDEHRPETNPELIESLRNMLSDAQNGRMVSMAAVYIRPGGDLLTVFHSPSVIEVVGATALLHRDALLIAEDD